MLILQLRVSGDDILLQIKAATSKHSNNNLEAGEVTRENKACVKIPVSKYITK